MRYLAMGIVAICVGMIVQNWNEPLAIAWVVAFCGWVPHCFRDQEAANGN